MSHYIAKNQTLFQRLALAHGVKPTGHGIANAAGLPAGTINAMFNGRPPSARTMACLASFFEMPTEALFDLIDDDEVVVLPALSNARR